MNRTLVIINLFILVVSVFIAFFMKKQFERFQDSKPAPVDQQPDTCSRVMHIGETYPASAQMNDPLRKAICSPACCGYQNSSLSCDKGCICNTPELQNMFQR